MHVYIIFAHPDKNSFNSEILKAFIRGLRTAGHTWEIGNLYEMEFCSEMDVDQYRREVACIPEAPVPDDVLREHQKISEADALAFIYPVWWSDCPARLKGWFDRVWNYGYAYYYDENEQRHTEIRIKKAVVICSAGHTVEHLEEIGIAESMRRIMLNDRLIGVGVRVARMEILGGMLPGVETYKEINLKRAFDMGKSL
jgi:NAD(P)H dehydrogenase (quinone)